MPTSQGNSKRYEHEDELDIPKYIGSDPPITDVEMITTNTPEYDSTLPTAAKENLPSET